MVSSTLTDKLREGCRALIADHLNHELDVFDQVWRAVWQMYGCTTVEEITALPDIGVASKRIDALGAAGGNARLASFNVIATAISATAIKSNGIGGDGAKYEEIQTLLQSEAERLNATPYNLKVLSTFGVPMIAALLRGKIDIERLSPGAIEHAGDGRLHVEWCETYFDKWPEPELFADDLTPEEVEGRFWNNRQRYALYIDERKPGIFINGDDVPVMWDALDRRHLLLLGLLLKAFQDRLPVRYDQIADAGHHSIDYIRDRARRTKSELDGVLKGVLQKSVKAIRSMNQYGMDGQIPYCWIRLGGRPSRMSC